MCHRIFNLTVSLKLRSKNYATCIIRNESLVCSLWYYNMVGYISYWIFKCSLASVRTGCGSSLCSRYWYLPKSAFGIQTIALKEIIGYIKIDSP
jgi:hypothetical protein